MRWSLSLQELEILIPVFAVEVVQNGGEVKRAPFVPRKNGLLEGYKSAPESDLRLTVEAGDGLKYGAKSNKLFRRRMRKGCPKMSADT